MIPLSNADTQSFYLLEGGPPAPEGPGRGSPDPAPEVAPVEAAPVAVRGGWRGRGGRGGRGAGGRGDDNVCIFVY